VAQSKAPAPTAPSAADPEAEISAYIAQAQQARATGDSMTAVKLLSQLVLAAPDDPRVVGEYGKALAAANRTDDAIAFLQRAIQLQPGDWTLYSAEGVAYDQKGQFAQAQDAYSRALSLKPGEPGVLNNDALSHMQAGDIAGAERLFREISPHAPGYDRVAKNLAMLEKLKPVQTAPVAPPAQPKPEPQFEQRTSAPVPAPPPVKQEVALITSEQAPTPLPVSLPPQAAPARSGIEALKMDPTVVMAPIPREETPRAKAAPSAKPSAGGKMYLQAGAYLSDARARQAAVGLDSLDVKIMTAMVNGREMFRLRIGPFTTMAEAKSAYAEAQALGRTDLMIVKE
jgi:Flp pilus assembly protein TadD